MIARTWRGWAPSDRADAYAAFADAEVVERYLAMPGNLGAVVLRRPFADGFEFLSFSIWASPEAMPAGMPEDHAILLGRETMAPTWEVVVGGSRPLAEAA